MSLVQNAGIVGVITVSPKVKIEDNKNVTPSNAEQVVTPSENFDALAQVTVGAVSLQNKSVTPTASQQSVTADEGYNGLGTVTVNAASDQFNTLMNNESSSPLQINVSVSGSSCKGFSSGGFSGGGYNLTISGGFSIEKDAFTYQKYLKNVVADEIDGMTNGDEFSYSGLITGHFAVLKNFVNNTFRGCNNITDLYFGYNGVVGNGPLMSGRIFNGKSSGTVNIHVPADQLANYQADSTWTGIIAAEAAAGVTVNLVGDYA